MTHYDRRMLTCRPGPPGAQAQPLSDADYAAFTAVQILMPRPALAEFRMTNGG